MEPIAKPSLPTRANQTRAPGGDVIAVGVDGCRAGWVAAVATAADPVLHVEVFPDIAVLCAWVRQHGDDPVVALDMPIGLPHRVGLRACDRAARDLLRDDPDPARRRFTSVFAPADREVLAAASYAEARAVIAARRELEPDARGVSAQSFAIAPKIREVDTFVRANPQCHEWLFEAHPEVCFREMARHAGRGGLTSKHAPAGQLERVNLLGPSLAAWGLSLPAPVPTVTGAGSDDVLDAFACLWTALRHRDGTSRVLGGDDDSRGVPMRIVV